MSNLEELKQWFEENYAYYGVDDSFPLTMEAIREKFTELRSRPVGDTWVSGWPVDPQAPQTSSNSTGPIPIQSRPVGDVEGYLDSTPVYIMSNETKQFVNGQGYVTFEDALAALQALKDDCDYEKQALTESCLQLTAEVERLKADVRTIRLDKDNWAKTAIDKAKEFSEYINDANRFKHVLEDLVQLKRWKDKHGKDTHYLSNVDSVWTEAMLIIDGYYSNPKL